MGLDILASFVYDLFLVMHGPGGRRVSGFSSFFFFFRVLAVAKVACRCSHRVYRDRVVDEGGADLAPAFAVDDTIMSCEMET